MEIENEFNLYLQRAGFKKENINPIQYDEIKKAFFAAAGQILILMRDNVSLTEESKAVSRLQNMLDEIGRFWELEVKKHNDRT